MSGSYESQRARYEAAVARSARAATRADRGPKGKAAKVAAKAALKAAQAEGLPDAAHAPTAKRDRSGAHP